MFCITLRPGRRGHDGLLVPDLPEVMIRPPGITFHGNRKTRRWINAHSGFHEADRPQRVHDVRGGVYQLFPFVVLVVPSW
jgi:hypothetical protein